MQLENILTSERCYCQLEGTSKKRILMSISEKLGQQFATLNESEVFNSMMAREQLGSTGLGNGIAIPHCRVPHCQGIIGALITLKSPIDFDSIDSKPVDLLFVLIVPEEETDEHVKTLASLAALFNDPDFCYTLRQAQNNEDLYNIAITF